MSTEVKVPAVKVNVDLLSAIVMVVVLGGLQSCDEQGKAFHQAAIQKCLDKGGVPIVRWLDRRQLSDCKFLIEREAR